MVIKDPHADSGMEDFGYKESLDRSIGKFASFAAGVSYISILTGTFQLFYFGFGTGGPGLSVVVADGVRRADGRRVVLHGAGGQVPRRGLGLQLDARSSAAALSAGRRAG